MADNFVLANAVTMRTTDTGSNVHVPHVTFTNPVRIVDVTLALDAGVAYATGDVMSLTAVVDGFFGAADQTAILRSIVAIDEDDQGTAFDVVFLRSNVALGATINSAADISDANAREIQGFISIAAGDYIDLGGVRVATKTGLSLPLRSISGTDDIAIATIARGAPTYSASGVRLRIGVSFA